MKTAIIVSSVNRAAILHETILGLRRQTVQPIEIVLSLCDAQSVLGETSALPHVSVIQGARGLTKQRNNALRGLPSEVQYVLFLDDDIELAPSYLESMEKLFDDMPEIVLASGGVCAADGPRLARAVSRAEAVSAVSQHKCDGKIVPAESAYGCNMFVKLSVLESTRFDEHLPLEGWLEDFDFSVRCAKRGRVVWNHGTCVAHLGVQRGLGERGFYVGYAQLANSYYLWQKGIIPSISKLLRNFWVPAVRVSLQGALHGKPVWNARFDYKGRLRGNAQALADAAVGRLKPERLLDFAEPRDRKTLDEKIA
jgi:GT2 family glycosyltransferase